MKTAPLERAWETLARFPTLALFPLAWDALLTLGMSALLGGLPGLTSSSNQIHAKFALPPSLPAGSQLLQDSAGTGTTIDLGSSLSVHPLPVVALILLAAALSALVEAGYLHLLVLALAGKTPEVEPFWEGIRRFGGRLLLWKVLVLLTGLVAALLLQGLGVLLLLLFFVAILWLYLTEFLVVTEDLPLPEAILQAGPRLRDGIGSLGPVFIASILASAVLTVLLSALRLLTWWVTAPLWAFLGTWLALGILAALQGKGEMGTRDEEEGTGLEGESQNPVGPGSGGQQDKQE